MVKMRISFLFLFLYAWVTLGHSTEASITRAAHFQPGLLAQEFDYTGHRGYWVDGISLLGIPDLPSEAMGLLHPAGRLPSGLSGLYARNPQYQRYGLPAMGSQGYIEQPSYLNPVDTPQTHLIWERYGFEGNSFHLDFRRLLTDSISLDLGVASHSTKQSANFRYQDLVHQPYTGTFKRDSSRVPFVGRNLAFSTMHLKPAITWYRPHSTVALQGSLLSLQNDDATRHLFFKDSLTYSKISFLTLPWENRTKALSFGALWNWRPTPYWSFEANHRWATLDISSSNTPKTWWKMDTTVARTGPLLERDTVLIDSVFYPTEGEERYQGQTGEWRLAHWGWFNPSLHFEYEYLYLNEWLDIQGVQDHPLYQDQQNTWFQMSDTLSRVAVQGQVGVQRFVSPTLAEQWEPAFMGQAILDLPWHLSVQGNWQHDTRFPDLSQTHVLRLGRASYPNADLRPEQRERQEGRVQWQKGEWLYGVGLRGEFADNAIVPRWTTQTRLASSLDPAVAFQWANRQHLESRDVFWCLGMALGNWKLFAEHGRTLDRNRAWNVPSRYYKGSVVWGNQFVEDRLKVSVRWDAQWFGNRWDYAIQSSGLAVPVELRHYLVLNFEARMQIKTFELYTRIDNMNHSLQEPEAGYTPEGVSFRYGIRWSFDD